MAKWADEVEFNNRLQRNYNENCQKFWDELLKPAKPTPELRKAYDTYRERVGYPVKNRLTYGSNSDGGLSFFDGKGQCVGQVANDDLLRLIQQAAKLLK